MPSLPSGRSQLLQCACVCDAANMGLKKELEGDDSIHSDQPVMSTGGAPAYQPALTIHSVCAPCMRLLDELLLGRRCCLCSTCSHAALAHRHTGLPAAQGGRPGLEAAANAATQPTAAAAPAASAAVAAKAALPGGNVLLRFAGSSEGDGDDDAAAAAAVQEVLSEAPKELCTLLEYPLQQTLASPEAQPFVEDNLKEVSHKPPALSSAKAARQARGGAGGRAV